MTKSKFQAMLDFLGQPMTDDGQLIESYWRAISMRDHLQADLQRIEMHLHLHQHYGKEEFEKKLSLEAKDIKKQLLEFKRDR